MPTLDRGVVIIVSGSLAVISFLNWPLAVIVLGVVAIFVFRPQVARLIDRMQQIKAPGVAIQTAAAQTGSSFEAQESAPKGGRRTSQDIRQPDRS
jgi:hypothetical protein